MKALRVNHTDDNEYTEVHGYAALYAGFQSNCLPWNEINDKERRWNFSISHKDVIIIEIIRRFVFAACRRERADVLYTTNIAKYRALCNRGGRTTM